MAATGGEIEDGGGEGTRKDSASSGVAALTEVEEMRIQIKKLQEKKTETLMKKVAQLEKERDVAMGGTKILQQTLTGQICLL